MTSNQRDKFRSVALAALMVVSVFAGAVALTGSSVAAPPGNTSVTDNTQAVNINVTATNPSQITVTNASYNAPGNVTNVTVDLNAGNDSANVQPNDVSSVTVTLFNSTGAQLNQVTASYGSNPTTVNVSAGNLTDVARIEVTADVASMAEDGDVLDAVVNATDAAGATSTNDDSRVTHTVFIDSAGFVRGNVEDSEGQAVGNADVDIVDQDSSTIVATTTTDSDGDFGPIKIAPGNYRADVVKPGFKSFSTNVVLGQNETEEILVTLESNRYANNLSVGVWDASNMRDAGENATLLANNESDTKVTYVVYADDQLNDPLNTSLDVTLQFTNGTATVGDFVDNDTIDQSTTVTIPASQTADVDGDGNDESYALVEVTSDNASQTSFTSAGHLGPIRTENFNATATNSQGTPLTDPANTTYVLEGQESVSGFVSDATTNEPVEGATVWVAYQTSGNHSLEYTQDTFVNEDGNSFLVTTTDEDGHYSITGLAGDSEPITVYVVESRYNRENLTNMNNVGRFVASSEDATTAGSGQTTQEVNHVVTPVEVILEYRLTLTGEVSADNQPPMWSDAIEMPTQRTRDLNLTIEVKTQTEPDSAFEPIEESDLVDSANVTFNVTSGRASGDVSSPSESIAAANEIEVPVSQSQDEGLVRFESSRTVGSSTVEASVTNTNDTTFTDTMTVDVFGVGQVSGDVANEDDQVLPFADVELRQFNTSSGEYETFDTTEAGPEGHYSFGGVPTGFEYEVIATFEGRTGFAQFNKTSAGTTTADIVVRDAASVSFQVTSFSDVSAESGSTATVSATIENVGEEQGTRTITLDVNGTEEGSQSVTLGSDSSTTVTFDVDTSGLSAGDYTMTVDTTDDTQDATLTVTNGSGSGIVDQYDENDNGVIDLTEAQSAIQDWSDGQISLSDVQSVIQNWANA